MDNPLQKLGDDWQVNADGVPYRKAARVIIRRPDQRVLLVKGHDFYDSRRKWWFTIGGGLAQGETSQEGALRELWEETGIRATLSDLQGPILEREATFYFLALTCRQDEMFYLLDVDDHTAESISPADLSDTEWGVLDELKWWDIDDLASKVEAGVTVYPLRLVDYLLAWRDGWDGHCLHLIEDSRTPDPENPYD
ncbi:MAG: NUDIX domain-containing protein [Actinomycetaceae bacterium]|nr:NUDIX domain-containing protein [Actinomycetaceae bacterium]